VKCNLKNVKTKSPLNPFCERLPRVLLSSTPSAQIKGASHVLCCVQTPKALLYVLAAGEKSFAGRNMRAVRICGQADK
jgi:hypothetical protein